MSSCVTIVEDNAHLVASILSHQTRTTNFSTNADTNSQSHWVMPVQRSMTTVVRFDGVELSLVSLSSRTNATRHSPSIKLSTQRIISTVRKLSRISNTSWMMPHDAASAGL